MKKKLFAAFAASTMLFSVFYGLIASAADTNMYAFDELMNMSFEELETKTGFEDISTKVDHIAENPPIYCRNGEIRYYILLKDYEVVNPSLWETVSYQDADGNVKNMELISKSKTAEILGLSERLLMDVEERHVTQTDSGSSVLKSTGLTEADILYVKINLKAYGYNICKAYYLVATLLPQSEKVWKVDIDGGVTGNDPEMVMGDVDMNGIVDVTDAQSVLSIYAENLAGNNPKLLKTQTQATDVNADGKIDSSDAQLILLYYVQNTLAGTPTTWDELLSRK